MTQTTAPTHRTRFGGRDLLATFGLGRVCAEGECATRLSRYNGENVCGVHAETNRPTTSRPAG